LTRRRAQAAIGAVLAATAAIAMAGCGDDDSEQESPLPAGCAEAPEPEPREAEATKRTEPLAEGASAVVETSCGKFTIELDTEAAPKTTASFAGLAEQGFYDGTAFHRIVPGFVVQGGDPTGEGTGGPGYTVDEEPPPDLAYLRGTVAMARSEVEPPGRSGSQFFVVVAPADAGLPPDYALLGEVSEGLDVVERIALLGSDDGTPEAPVVIETVRIEGS
jgi:cyclophilin family peptidyl-prolyl cis-trans isomerase